MKLIVGLGNPGQKYLDNRHNIGFIVVDHFARRFNASPYKSEKKALVTKVIINGEPVLLCKPQTYMNLSGVSVQALVDYYDIALENLFVIHDDVDQAFGGIKVQFARGHGGNNGIRDIHRLLTTNEYARLKFGVGRPANPKMDVADHVLQDFSKQEQAELTDLIDESCSAIEEFIQGDWKSAANKYNKKGI